MMKIDERDYARGALMGLAVGDALGASREFERPPNHAHFPLLETGPLTDMAGGGPHRVAPGQVTDDTQMAVALADSLLRCNGFDLSDAAMAYARWLHHAFDVGTQTQAVLWRVGSGAPPEQASREHWEKSDPPAAGNGSLMRTVPIAVFFRHDTEHRRAASLDDSAITHFDPRCRLACAAFNAAVAVGLRGDASEAAMIIAARHEILESAHVLESRYPGLRVAVGQAAAALQVDLTAAEQDDPHLYGEEIHLIRHQGFVRVAFRLAFWHLVHTGSFSAALIDVVNRGGDADTNGAITGALLGARLGVDAIPQHWRDLVMHALEGQTGPLAEDYHPRRLLALV